MTNQHVLIDLADESQSARWLIRWTFLSLVMMLLWAGIFKLDEITRGQGKVIPSSREQVIQSLDSGVLREMLVREGDLVEKDQVLLRMDDVRSGAVFREAQEKYLALLAQASRLKAEAYGFGLVFPPELDDEPELKDQETKAYQVRQRALNEALQALTASWRAITREIELTSPMVAQGLMSEVELLRLRRQQADITGQRADRKNKYLTEANNELARVNSELAQTQESRAGREIAFTNTVIKSPVNGVVKNVQINTVGGVIQAGQAILEIVPVDDELVVEAYVKPADVAFLHVGQAALVKLSAYDFSKYGGLEGVLEHVSPDTLTDDRQRRFGSTPVDLQEGYYRILVRIKDQSLTRQGSKIQPSAGMTATVEIRTGEKTVLEYLIRPLLQVRQALRER